MGKVISVKSLEGVHEFTGVDMLTMRRGESGDEAFCINFELDGKCYLAVEDPMDGERSSLRCIELTRRKPKNQFKPARVRVVHALTEQYDLLTFFKWKSDTILLQMGTDNCDDYYPRFVSFWNPEGLSKAKK